MLNTTEQESIRGPLGSGTADFAETLAALERIGYAGTITFESFSLEATA
jgi:sugar phosphate isomerase/epimerase